VNRRYLLLLAAVVAAAILLSVAGRLPRTTREAVAPVAAIPRVALTIVVKDGAVEPAFAQVERDHAVDLTVENAGAGPVTLVLGGYEDRFTARIEPGTRWEGQFVADRPGDDFAWMIGGSPAGRLAVAGSHLVEGHR
jgi:hypothetical protein